MSRIAKEIIPIPQGVEVVVDGQKVTVKSKKGELSLDTHNSVTVSVVDNAIKVSVNDDSTEANMQSGTTRALLHNYVTGLDKGFERALKLVGVGYRAQAQGKTINLVVGYSHPVNYELPEGVTAETPTQTDIILKGYDKAVLGQVAANLREIRHPEPYKGKGIRYADEVIHLKEAKKK